jgi:hypothetical protein
MEVIENENEGPRFSELFQQHAHCAVASVALVLECASSAGRQR